MLENKRCVLVADDEPKMVRALRDFLCAIGFCVLEAKDGEEALDVFCENSNVIDIILLDVMMPRRDGLSTLKLIRESSSLVPVILLTARGEEYDQLAGFSCGADDYITKPFSPSLLMARVEAVLRRFGKDVQNDISAGMLSINAATRTVYLENEELELTRREYDLLYYLIVNRGLAFSREQLLNNVWGYDFEGGSRTVDTHIRQLRGKLGKCADYIKTIHCVGYQFEVQNENPNS
ncbi:MAG: response regulator transcription factor [Oscillospiraceae bacterium]|nr:response regulator transcription factor [Oscillospiraceae bacterium]